MKTLKTLALLLLLHLSLVANENQKDISLLDFSEFVSTHNNINIYVDEDFKKQIVSIFLPEKITNEALFYVYNSTLADLNLTLLNFDGVYYISKVIPEDLQSYFIKIKTNSHVSISKYLTFKGVKFQHIETDNVFIIYCKDIEYAPLLADIKKIDSQNKQVTLKFTIIEINDDDLKEQGFQYSSIYKDSDGITQNILNTFIFPFQSSKPIFPRTSFYGALKLFNENKFLNISQNPYVLAQDNKDFTFQAVNTIPYQISSTITQASNYSQQNQIEYKDVGLKIIGKTLIYEDYVNLDLDLVIEDILSTTDNIPTTYKRQLKSNTNLKYGEVLLLSGINQTKINKTDFSIPFISNIPYLGELFKYKSTSEVKSNISIAIEVIK